MNIIANTGTTIDWDSVILECLRSQGTILTYNEKCFPNTEDFRSLDSLWKSAGYEYNNSRIEWINYFPGTDFDQTVVGKFESLVNAKPWMVWISRIKPGKMAPWHFDAHQNINEIYNLGKPVRYTCYIQEANDGHISIVDQTAVYRPVKGSIYRWPTHDSWHCGMNGGMVDKFMFNYWGYE